MTELQRYADPKTIECERCHAQPDAPCLDSRGNPMDNYHATRERQQKLYECRHCNGPCAVSVLSGALVHLSMWTTSTHNAEPYDDLRGWKA